MELLAPSINAFVNSIVSHFPLHPDGASVDTPAGSSPPPPEERNTQSCVLILADTDRYQVVSQTGFPLIFKHLYHAMIYAT